MTDGWESKFDIDAKGFAVQMSEMDSWRLVQEIISNSFDEKSAKKIQVDIGNKGSLITVFVKDDGKGFKKPEHAYTLFADSDKRTDSKTRGRYNLGEKQFFAVCKSGYVKTKNVHIEFSAKGKRITEIFPKFEGTEIYAEFKWDMTSKEIVDNLRKIAVRKDKQLFINKVEVEPKQTIHQFKARLRTPVASGKNQKMVDVIQECDVYLYEADGENALIYELGIPIEELSEGIAWHVDVDQKVPQTITRDVITTAYKQRLYSEIAQNTTHLLDRDTANESWAELAMKHTDEDTTKAILQAKYGTSNIMVESTVDTEANERAMEHGVKLIAGMPSFMKDNLKSMGMLKFATEEFSTSGWEMAIPVMETPEMKKFARLCNVVAIDVIGKPVIVNFVTTEKTNEIASYGHGILQWNVGRLGGKEIFKQLPPLIYGTLVHELSHDKIGHNNGHAHLSFDFINEEERIFGEVLVKGLDHYWRLVENVQ